jgi:hypothetical protein
VVSDHLPLQTAMSINVSVCAGSQDGGPARFCTQYPHIDWSDTNQCEKYTLSITKLSNHLPQINTDDVTDHENARTQVTIMCDAMKDVVHTSVAHVQEQKSDLYRGKYKKKHWWNTDCLQARDRQRFWHKLSDSIGRPRGGHVHTCYKLAKKAYRSVCRTAVNVNVHQSYRQMEFYLGVRSIKKFWNLIRRSKCTSGSTVSDITLDTLHDYYSKKFSRNDQDVSVTIRNAECIVNQNYVAAKDNVHLDFTMRESMLLEYMGKLRTGCAAGIDGITKQKTSSGPRRRSSSLCCVIC